MDCLVLWGFKYEQMLINAHRWHVKRLVFSLNEAFACIIHWTGGRFQTAVGNGGSQCFTFTAWCCPSQCARILTPRSMTNKQKKKRINPLSRWAGLTLSPFALAGMKYSYPSDSKCTLPLIGQVQHQQGCAARKVVFDDLKFHGLRYGGILLWSLDCALQLLLVRAYSSKTMKSLGGWRDDMVKMSTSLFEAGRMLRSYLCNEARKQTKTCFLDDLLFSPVRLAFFTFCFPLHRHPSFLPCDFSFVAFFFDRLLNWNVVSVSDLERSQNEDKTFHEQLRPDHDLFLPCCPFSLLSIFFLFLCLFFFSFSFSCSFSPFPFAFLFLSFSYSFPCPYETEATTPFHLIALESVYGNDI